MAPLPVTADLTAYRGDTWAQGFQFLRGGAAVNLTGATVKSQARASDGTVVDLAVVIDAPPTDGHVTLSVPLTVPPATYRYDIEVDETSGTVTTWVRGLLTVQRDVTNEPP